METVKHKRSFNTQPRAGSKESNTVATICGRRARYANTTIFDKSTTCEDCKLKLAEFAAAGEARAAEHAAEVFTISQAPNKRADTLAGLNMPAEGYHASIKRAAQRLVAAGLNEWEYQTQYGSGTTLWNRSDRHAPLMVKPDGEIKF